MNPKRFKEIRQQLGLTQEEMSQLLGVADKTVINRYEAGSRSPSKLAEAILEMLSEMTGKEAQVFMERLLSYINHGTQRAID